MCGGSSPTFFPNELFVLVSQFPSKNESNRQDSGLQKVPQAAKKTFKLSSMYNYRLSTVKEAFELSVARTTYYILINVLVSQFSSNKMRVTDKILCFKRFLRLHKTKESFKAILMYNYIQHIDRKASKLTSMYNYIQNTDRKAFKKSFPYDSQYLLYNVIDVLVSQSPSQN